MLDEIQRLADAVASSYFSGARCIGVVGERPGVFLKRPELPVFRIALNASATDDNLLAAINAGCLAFVVQTDDVVSVAHKFISLFRSPASVHRANRRYICLPQAAGDDRVSRKVVMDELFNAKPMNWMPDLLFVDLLPGNEALDDLNSTTQVGSQRQGNVFAFEVYTHKFVGSDPAAATLLDVWMPGRGFVHGADLYPDKVHDLMGKKMKSMSIIYPPFTVAIFDSEKPLYSGLDYEALFAFGKKHNITFANKVDEENSWGDIWSNGSGSGVIGDMAMDKTDFAISSLYMIDKGLPVIDYSVPYYQSCVAAVTPRPKALPAWLIPVRPFNSLMWYAVLASVITATLVLYVISKASEVLLGGDIASRYFTLLECGFRTAGLLVLQVPDDERDYAAPRYAPMRHLVTWITVFFVVVTSAYGGGLSSILTIPQFSPPIDSIKQLADSGLVWYGPDEAYMYTVYKSTNPALKAVAEKYIVLPEEDLVRLAADDTSILLVERLERGVFADFKYITKDTMQIKRLMRENMFCEHLYFAFSKGSPYKESLNALLFKLRQTGILYYWEGLMSRQFLSQSLHLAIMESRAPPETSQIVLGFEHVQGAFYLLGLGLLLASLTCTLELAMFYSAEKKKRGSHVQ